MEVLMAYASNSPRRLRTRPYVLTTTGTLRLPTGFPPAQACKGVVRIRYLSGRSTVVNATYFAAGRGANFGSIAANGMPCHGITMLHASTQRSR